MNFEHGFSTTLTRDLCNAFTHDIDDGTIEIFHLPHRDHTGTHPEVWIDGGNWFLSLHDGGPATLALPHNDQRYYDEDPDTFLDNVLSTCVIESLRHADRLGVIADMLKESPEVWTKRLGERIV